MESLRKELAWINSCIYAECSSGLENDRIQLQVAIKDHEAYVWSSDSKTFNEKWLFREGKLHPEFLHLEDLKLDCREIKALQSKDGTISEIPDGILSVMHEFYSELYQAKLTTEIQEFKHFLQGLNLPKLQDTTDQGPICE